jgi:hypothetical protein
MKGQMSAESVKNDKTKDSLLQKELIADEKYKK